MQTTAANFPWLKELEKTVVHSLATSFGLDFLLFQDKTGGNVDTVHNVRQDIYASESERQQYEERGNYKDLKSQYHSHKNYIDTGRNDKRLQESGNLHDAYRNKTMRMDEQRNLDHIISANEIHNDRGRVLAEMDGIELANQSSNLQTTLETVNKSKKDTPISEWLDNLPERIENFEHDVVNKKSQLAQLPQTTPEEKHQYREMEDDIRKQEEKIKNLKDVDPEAMHAKDKEARAKYDAQISRSYYSSSKFLKQAGKDAAISGVNMGVRQVLGLVMAEVWFELRSQVPAIIQSLKNNFNLEAFIARIQDTFKGIWQRIQKQFKDFLSAFKDGFFGGVMSSVTTTIFNIFTTTYRSAIKIIREIWGQMVKAFKLIFFNPDKLGFVDLCKAVVGILSTAAGITIGSIAHAHLLPLCNFPFGAELAAFASALVTGLVTLGLTYFLLYNEVAQKLWAFIESIMPHAGTVKKYQAINTELDRYLIELTRLEFNMNPDEMEAFSKELSACNDEMQRSLVLKNEVAKLGIELPYEMGNGKSTRQWLKSLTK